VAKDSDPEFRESRFNPIGEPLAFRRQPNGIGPPITRIIAAFQQPQRTQIIEKSHNRLDFNADVVGQGDLANPAPETPNPQQRRRAGFGNVFLSQDLLRKTPPLPPG
jgi:hypothetical protein